MAQSLEANEHNSLILPVEKLGHRFLSQLINRPLLSIYYVSGAVLSPGNTKKGKRQLLLSRNSQSPNDLSRSTLELADAKGRCKT